MLKNKKAIYILIPLNLFIWGYLGYSIYNGLSGEEEEEIPPVTTVVKTLLKADKDSVTYQLKLNYPDPFLREGVKVREPDYSVTDKVATSPKPKVVAVVKTPTLAPKPADDIKYLGLVKNNTTGVSTALISINGRTYIIKKGDAVTTYTIKEVYSDYVELKDGKTILKINK